MTARFAIVSAILAFAVWSYLHNHSYADFRKGLEAYNRGDYKAALLEWRSIANRGDVQAQMKLGDMYAQGKGVPGDLVQAYVWFDLAASSNLPENRIASEKREAIKKDLSQNQLEKAKQMARGWVLAQEKNSGVIAMMLLSEIGDGKIRHEKLTEVEISRIQSIHEAFKEVRDIPLDSVIEDFKHDAHPDREIAVWEIMAKAFKQHCETRKLSLEEKKEVYKVIVLRGLAMTEDEVLARANLKLIKEIDAREVMKSIPVQRREHP